MKIYSCPGTLHYCQRAPLATAIPFVIYSDGLGGCDSQGNCSRLIAFNGGINPYSYVGGNPLSYVDPAGLWAFGFEAYAGLGGGLTFGRDAVTGQPFLNIRFGYGFGGGFDYDPLAKRPGSDPCDMGSGEAFGLYGKAGGRAGPIKGGLGFNGGFQNGSSPLPTNPYGTFASPKVSFTNQGTGFSATAAAGAEFTFYGRGK